VTPGVRSRPGWERENQPGETDFPHRESFRHSSPEVPDTTIIADHPYALEPFRYQSQRLKFPAQWRYSALTPARERALCKQEVRDKAPPAAASFTISSIAAGLGTDVGHASAEPTGETATAAASSDELQKPGLCSRAQVHCRGVDGRAAAAAGSMLGVRLFRGVPIAHVAAPPPTAAAAVALARRQASILGLDVAIDIRSPLIGLTPLSKAVRC
jgi:hypothetical protein